MVACLLVLGLTVVACGGGTTEATTAETTATTIASTPDTVATTLPAAPTTTAAAVETPATGDSVVLEIGAIDNEGFTRDRLEAKAGQAITVIFKNEDVGGEPHNWHLVVVAGTTDYATEIKDAPDTQEVTFTILAAGEYQFFCDTHAETMKGILTVTP